MNNRVKYINTTPAAAKQRTAATQALSAPTSIEPVKARVETPVVDAGNTLEKKVADLVVMNTKMRADVDRLLADTASRSVGRSPTAVNPDVERLEQQIAKQNRKLETTLEIMKIFVNGHMTCSQKISNLLDSNPS